MSLSLVGTATDLVSGLGYEGLAIGLFLDSFGVPIPSEVLIPLAVVATRTGRFDLWAVVVVAVASQLAGAHVSYGISRWLGRAVVDRYGRYVLLSRRDLDWAERAFTRHGSWIVGAGRCFPFVRGFIGYPAGAANMPIAPFALWTAAGALGWTAVLVGLGEVWRHHLSTISRIVDDVSIVVIAALVLAVAAHIWRSRRRSRSDVR